MALLEAIGVERRIQISMYIRTANIDFLHCSPSTRVLMRCLFTHSVLITYRHTFEIWDSWRLLCQKHRKWKIIDFWVFHSDITPATLNWYGPSYG